MADLCSNLFGCILSLPCVSKLLSFTTDIAPGLSGWVALRSNKARLIFNDGFLCIVGGNTKADAV